MPRTISGIFMFAVMATVTVVVGTWVYNKAVAPILGKFMAKAA
jgi:hypothetical protein